MHRIKRAAAWSIRTRRRRIATALTTLALIGAGVGIAAWITQASAPGASGRAGAIAQPTFEPVTVFPSDALYPGETSDGIVRVTNPGAPLNLTGWTAGVLSGNLTVNGAMGVCGRRRWRAPSRFRPELGA
jgi:hypothetical protein